MLGHMQYGPCGHWTGADKQASTHARYLCGPYPMPSSTMRSALTQAHPCHQAPVAASVAHHPRAPPHSFSSMLQPPPQWHTFPRPHAPLPKRAILAMIRHPHPPPPESFSKISSWPLARSRSMCFASPSPRNMAPTSAAMLPIKLIWARKLSEDADSVRMCGHSSTVSVACGLPGPVRVDEAESFGNH